MPRLAELIPPVVHRLRAALLKRQGMYGNFASWDEAARHGDGYGDATILDRVRSATLAVRDGKAAFERDGVLFDRVHYSHPLLAGLLYGAALHGNALDVLDFGGSLGSSYFQCKRFFAPLARVRWSVVEQGNFVAAGRDELETEELRFFADIDACLAAQRPHVLVLASVLQFLPDPLAILRRLLAHPFDVVIVDRTPMWNAPTRITVQHVPAEIYGRPIRYPARILNRDELVGHFSSFELVSEFETDDGPIWSGAETGWHGGFIAMRKRAA